MINGQLNLHDAIRRQVDFKQGEKTYALRTDRKLPTLICRARGWHLDEKHFTVDGEAISAGLFDFGLYFFNNAHELVQSGTGPYFYLPKMESHLEARLWNDVFNMAQDYIGMSRGTIRGTVLIETITAAFEMDEVSDKSAVDNLRFADSPGDYLRTKGSQRRPQLWSLGLYLQCYQEVPTKLEFRPSRPIRRDDDRSVHGRLCSSSDQDMPQERSPCNGKKDSRELSDFSNSALVGWHGRTDSDQGRQRSERQGHGQCRGGQAPGSACWS